MDGFDRFRPKHSRLRRHPHRRSQTTFTLHVATFAIAKTTITAADILTHKSVTLTLTP